MRNAVDMQANKEVGFRRVGASRPVFERHKSVVRARKQDLGSGRGERLTYAGGHIQIDIFLDKLVGEVAYAAVFAAMASIHHNSPATQRAFAVFANRWVGSGKHHHE